MSRSGAKSRVSTNGKRGSRSGNQQKQGTGTVADGATTTTAAAAHYANGRRRSKAVAFGRNYYHALGGTDKLTTSIPVSTLAREPSQAAATTPASSLTSVDTYQWEAPPWRKANGNTHLASSHSDGADDDDIEDAVCTAQSTVFRTRSGKVFQTGTIHGQIRESPRLLNIPMPLQCVEVAGGRHFCLARMEGGLAVVSWGAGHFGQLGIGTMETGNDSQITFTPQPIIVERLLPHMIGTPIQQIAAGDWHALALSKSGRVWAWGSNRSQQCGRKPSSRASSSQAPTITVPLPVPLDVPVMQISAGRSHSVAITRDTGQVYCWGSSNHGQCGNVVRRAGGSGVAPPRRVEGFADLKMAQVAAAGNHTLAVTTGGRVFSWGSGTEGELGLGPMVPSQAKPRLVADLDFVAIAAGQEWRIQQNIVNSSNHSVESGSNSTNNSGSHGANHLAAIPRVAKVFAGPSYSAVITTSGHVYSWGSNDAGQIGHPTPEDLPMRDNYSPPGPGSAAAATGSSGHLREMHVQTFDSRHNVLLPSRVMAADHVDVKMVACGPNHMWCIGHERPAGPPVAVGRTLYEVQEEEHYRRIQRARAQGPSALARVLQDHRGESVGDPEDGTVATTDYTVGSYDTSATHPISGMFIRPGKGVPESPDEFEVVQGLSGGTHVLSPPTLTPTSAEPATPATSSGVADESLGASLSYSTEDGGGVVLPVSQHSSSPTTRADTTCAGRSRGRRPGLIRRISTRLVRRWSSSHRLSAGGGGSGSSAAGVHNHSHAEVGDAGGGAADAVSVTSAPERRSRRWYQRNSM